MKKPRNINLIPRGGYSVTFPETGHTVTSNHPSAFLQECNIHMKLNGMTIAGGWQDMIWDRFCNQHPDVECDDSETVERVVAMEDVWKFLTTLWESMEQGAKAVPQEEADRRSDICVACNKMGHTSCFFGCGKFSEVLSTLTLGRQNKNSSAIHKASCGVCGCEISSLVNYPLEVLQAVDEKVGFKRDEYPEKCWKRG